VRNKSPAQLFLKTRGVVLLGRGDIKARKNQKSGQVEDAIFPFYINKKQRTRRAKKHAIIPYKRTYKENMCIKTTFIKCSSGLDMYTITGFGRTSPVCQKKKTYNMYIHSNTMRDDSAKTYKTRYALLLPKQQETPPTLDRLPSSRE